MKNLILLVFPVLCFSSCVTFKLSEPYVTNGVSLSKKKVIKLGNPSDQKNNTFLDTRALTFTLPMGYNHLKGTELTKDSSYVIRKIIYDKTYLDTCIVIRSNHENYEIAISKAIKHGELVLQKAPLY